MTKCIDRLQAAVSAPERIDFKLTVPMPAMRGLAHLSDYMQHVAAAVSGRHPHS